MIAEAEAYGFTFRYPAADKAVGRCLREHGEFARVEGAFAAQMSRGGVFIDVGANIGALTLPVARHAKRVIAVEGHRGLAELLKENVAANGLANVDVIHAAVSDRAGQVEFPTPSLAEARNFGDNGLGQKASATEMVASRTLDELTPRDTRVVKIDVQGHELAVLDGAAETLRTRRPIWIVEVGGDSPRARVLVQRFLGHDYRLYWFFSPFVTRIAVKNPQSERAIVGDTNIVAFPLEGPQPADMKPVDLAEGWPAHVRDFPYLRRFGFERA